MMLMVMMFDGCSERLAGTQINRSKNEELEKRTSGQKQVFGLGGCERKGQQRLDDEIRAVHDSEGAKLGSGCTAQRSTEIAGPARRDRAGA